jgi:(p)ppGpp synthase/HD superfamily hydrolase
MGARAAFMDEDTAHRLFAIKIAADHASRAHKGQFRKDKKTPFITHPARVAALVGMFGGSHSAIVAAWLHDVYENCTPDWIIKTQAVIDGLPLVADDRDAIVAMIDALTKKNTIKKKSARLSESLDRVLNAPPEATLVKICDRIDNLLDTADRNGGFTKRYLASTDEVIAKLSTRAEGYGYEPALQMLTTIRHTDLKME